MYTLLPYEYSEHFQYGNEFLIINNNCILQPQIETKIEIELDELSKIGQNAWEIMCDGLWDSKV